jgi:hypothetical protein
MYQISEQYVSNEEYGILVPFYFLTIFFQISVEKDSENL